MGRLLAISDIHGCIKSFDNLINKVQLTKKDKLIVLGDNIDRGPNNLDVIMRIMKLKQEGYNIITLKGNHESMFLDLSLEYEDEEAVLASPLLDVIMHNGTYKTLMEYWALDSEDKVDILKEIMSYEDYYVEGDYLFVHAGVQPGIKLENQDIDDLFWIRDNFVNSASHGLPYTVIFGHTPTRNLNINRENKIWYDDDKIGIDCGAVHEGKLACLDLTNNLEYYVDGFKLI